MILPKQNKQGEYYLSYSQVSSFLKNKKDYFKRYFFGEGIDFTAYLDFGKDLGEAIAKGDYSNYKPSEQKLLNQIVRLDEFEKEIRIDFDGFHIIGYIDSNCKDYDHIIDYKTAGIGKEAQYTEEDYIQLQLYALGIKQQYGKVPKRAEVHAIERLGNAYKGEPLTVGNNINIIPIDISEERLTFAKETVERAAKEISDYYQIFLQLNKPI